jgi:hypothetical protein
VPPPGDCITEAGALCSRGITPFLSSYDPLRLPNQAYRGISASGLISSAPTVGSGGPGGASSLTPRLGPCMLPPVPREPWRFLFPVSSTANCSLRLFTRARRSPLPALAAMHAGCIFTGLFGRSLALRPAGLSPSLGCVRPHLPAEPSRTFVGPLRYSQLPSCTGTQTTRVNRGTPEAGSFHPARVEASASLR